MALTPCEICRDGTIRPVLLLVPQDSSAPLAAKEVAEVVACGPCRDIVTKLVPQVGVRALAEAAGGGR